MSGKPDNCEHVLGVRRRSSIEYGEAERPHVTHFGSPPGAMQLSLAQRLTAKRVTLAAQPALGVTDLPGCRQP